MTIKNRLSRLEKVIKPGIKKTDLNYPLALEALAKALHDLTGREITTLELEELLLELR